MFNNEDQKELASQLIKIEAVKLSPKQPFTWSSGWKAPIYCDNRKTLSFQETRNFIKNHFADLTREKYPQTQVIAGVATGGIAHGVLLADLLNLPFVYVRDKAKNHGEENLIEGIIHPGQKVLVIEDLVSTGESSINAVETLRQAQAEVLGMASIFTYNFDVAEEMMAKANCELTSLTNYKVLVELAKETGYINNLQAEVLESWRESPAEWGR